MEILGASIVFIANHVCGGSLLLATYTIVDGEIVDYFACNTVFLNKFFEIIFLEKDI